MNKYYLIPGKDGRGKKKICQQKEKNREVERE